MDFDAIIMTLKTINWNYGKGDIRNVNFSMNTSKTVDRETGEVSSHMYGTVSREMTSHKDERKFTITNDKLTFLGRKRKIKL